MKQIIIDTELKNIAPRFSKAIWRRYNVNRGYMTAAEAWKYHKRENCNYRVVNIDDETGEETTITEHKNGKMDAYGTRFN